MKMLFNIPKSVSIHTRPSLFVCILSLCLAGKLHAQRYNSLRRIGGNLGSYHGSDKGFDDFGNCLSCDGEGKLKNRNYKENRLGSFKYIICPYCKGKGKIDVHNITHTAKPEKTKPKPPPLPLSLQKLKKQYRAALRKYRALVTKRRFTGGVVMPTLESKITTAKKEAVQLQTTYREELKKQKAIQVLKIAKTQAVEPKRIIKAQKQIKVVMQKELNKNNDKQAFKNFNFEDSTKIIIYKIKQHKDIKFKYSTVSEKSDYIFCDSRFAGIPCVIYFKFNNEFKLVKMNISLPEQSASYYDNSIKDNWQKLHDIVASKYGKPTIFYGFPSFFKHDPDYVQYASKWDLKYKIIATGVSCSEYKYQPGLIITYKKHVIADQKKQAAINAANKAKAASAL
jgi:hypothetical protein